MGRTFYEAAVVISQQAITFIQAFGCHGQMPTQSHNCISDRQVVVREFYAPMNALQFHQNLFPQECSKLLIEDAKQEVSLGKYLVTYTTSIVNHQVEEHDCISSPYLRLQNLGGQDLWHIAADFDIGEVQLVCGDNSINATRNLLGTVRLFAIEEILLHPSGVGLNGSDKLVNRIDMADYVMIHYLHTRYSNMKMIAIASMHNHMITLCLG